MPSNNVKAVNTTAKYICTNIKHTDTCIASVLENSVLNTL